MKKLRAKAERSDVLMDGSINKLVRDNLITNEMATSLMNDSANVTGMINSLIKFGELMYLKRDLIIEDEAATEEELEEAGILTAEEEA